MDLIVERVEVWAAPIDDQPGSLATTRSAAEGRRRSPLHPGPAGAGGTRPGGGVCHSAVRRCRTRSRIDRGVSRAEISACAEAESIHRLAAAWLNPEREPVRASA